MLKYFGVRLLLLLPKLLIITIIIFLAIQIVPGDPITRSMNPDMLANMSDAQIEEIRENMGLNDPLPVRYFNWIGDLLQGDLGYSQVTGGDINDLIARHLPKTMELAILGLGWATIVGILFGYISAIKQHSIADYGFTTLGIIGISVPQFFFGLLGILIFGLTLDWLPTGGRMAVGETGFFQRIEYLVMPVFVLGIVYVSTLMRYTRGSMLDVMGKDYIKVARSKGLSESKVNIKHGLRNALIPILVVVIMRLPYLVAGTVVVEAVFNYAGMGSILIQALSGADLPVVMIVTMLISMMILFASFLVDVVSALLDPRIRLGSSKGGA